MESQSGQADTELVAAFLAKTAGRHASDEDVGKLLNPPVDGSTIGSWRRKIGKMQPVGLRPKNRLSLQKFLWGSGATDADAFRDGVRAAIAEIRARLQEMEERLR
jgi:hypothetical protein